MRILFNRGVLLEDVWLAEISWPVVKWEQLWQGNGHNTKDSPPARRGHAMVYAPSKDDPLLIIMGGRTTNEAGYFMDVWAFHLKSQSWEEFTPEKKDLSGRSSQPVARDHFPAMYYDGAVYLFSGRGGESYNKSVPLADLWKFEIKERRWVELHPHEGPQPRARFLASMSMANVDGGGFIVFGGEGFGPEDTGRFPNARALLQEDGDGDDDDDDGLEGHSGSFSGCYMK